MTSKPAQAQLLAYEQPRSSSEAVGMLVGHQDDEQKMSTHTRICKILFTAHQLLLSARIEEAYFPHTEIETSSRIYAGGGLQLVTVSLIEMGCITGLRHSAISEQKGRQACPALRAPLGMDRGHSTRIQGNYYMLQSQTRRYLRSDTQCGRAMNPHQNKLEYY